MRCAQLQTQDNKVTLQITSGTRMQKAAGQSLLSMTATLSQSPPQPPPLGAIVLAYDFGPDGATFNPAITMTMSYNPNTLPKGASESDLFIAYWDGKQWVPVTSNVNTSTHMVSAAVSRSNKRIDL